VSPLTNNCPLVETNERNCINEETRKDDRVALKKHRQRCFVPRVKGNSCARNHAQHAAVLPRQMLRQLRVPTDDSVLRCAP